MRGTSRPRSTKELPTLHAIPQSRSLTGERRNRQQHDVTTRNSERDGRAESLLEGHHRKHADTPPISRSSKPQAPASHGSRKADVAAIPIPNTSRPTALATRRGGLIRCSCMNHQTSTTHIRSLTRRVTMSSNQTNPAAFVNTKAREMTSERVRCNSERLNCLSLADSAADTSCMIFVSRLPAAAPAKLPRRISLARFRA